VSVENGAERAVENGGPVRRTTEVVAAFLPLKGQRILEVGCGEGALLGWARRRGAQALGIEVEPGRLERARRSLGGEGLLVGVGEALPFADSCFDAVLYHNSFHHVPVDGQTEALVEAARVLRPSGRLLILEPLAEGEYFELLRPLEDETAIRAAALRALERAADLGFDTIAAERWRQLVERRSPDELLAALVAADPARRARLGGARPLIEAAWTRLGTPGRDGRVFVQPMIGVVLERRAEGPVIGVARCPADRAAVLELRKEVFVDEQGVPVAEEIDGFDESSEHVLARLDGEPVGCSRWRRLGPDGTVKIERLAIRRTARGRGVARAVLAWCLARIDGKGLGPCVVHAQLHALDLYTRFGFRPEGEPFLEAGIPHLRFVRPAARRLHAAAGEPRRT
jgi:predicted GNAT family N-acyltransferase/ubiquinone/menaquinone biosynthesis C-methylase UbiE